MFVTNSSNFGNLQIDVNYLVQWCNKNLMKQYKNVILERVSSFKNLGVLLVYDITFIGHIDNISLTCFRFLGFLKRHIRHINDTKVILTLYD